MQIRDLSKPVTSKQLNESLANKFGYKLNLEQFNDVQLEDVRNKLRTEISQFEVSESFDNLHGNAKYQKTRALLDVINQAILEREMTAGDKAEEEKLKSKYDKSGMKKSMQQQYGNEEGKKVYFATIRKKAMDHSVPEGWIENAIKRIQLGESDQEELAAELTIRYDLTESQANHILYLQEGEEEEAKVIMATKDMVDRITGWLEDTAAMKAEQLLELLDSIRETKGSDVAQAYEEQVKPALEAIYTALETSRTGLTGALSVIKGEMPTPMGAPAAAPATPGMAPELGATVPGEETPPAPELGREKRESIDYSRRLGMLLASKKK